MLKVVIELSTYLDLFAGFKSKTPRLRFGLPKLALFFDEIYCFSCQKVDLFETKPFGSFIEVEDQVFSLFPKYAPPTTEQEEDVRNAYGEKQRQNDEGGEYAYYLIKAMLDISRKRSCYFYVHPGYRDGFINFCLKNQPDYLPAIKESFLLFDILDYVFQQQVPAFDPMGSKELIAGFADYKKDLQEGILRYAKRFKGSYKLSDDQKTYIREEIANEEKRLLDFLKPGNLRKLKISKLDLGGDLVGSAASLLFPLTVPISTLLNLSREIKKVKHFRDSNLDFILSLFVLKQMTDIGKTGEAPSCAVCDISLFEIEQMTEDQCDRILLKGKLCEKHLVGFLDLNKRFRLFGKALLRELKRLGNLSVLIDKSAKTR